MKVLVTGGTGFIGTSLCHALLQHGHEVLVVTRRVPSQLPCEDLQYLSWNGNEWQRAMATVQGVVNLAGAPLASKRWTTVQKRVIRESRVHTTRTLVNAIASQGARPTVLVNASAVGYYGPHGDEELSERTPAGEGFLAELCQAWEQEAQRAETLGVRVIRLRMGLVLGPGGGALAKMIPPFRYGLGGPLGHGRQWVSWIHHADVNGLIEWALIHPHISGAINATAPNPVPMRDLCRALGRVLRRPSWAPVPAGALRVMLGEMAQLLLTGQRVLPHVALREGYAFQFSEVAGALESCLPAAGRSRK